MNKIDINKKIKRESLLNTAYNLFTTKGFNKTSIAEIVENAGVAKGTFYLYFKDKYDIRDKLIVYKSARVLNLALKSLETQQIEEFQDRIIFVVDNIINQFSENKPLLEFISKNHSWGIFKNAVVMNEGEDISSLLTVYDRMLASSPKELIEPELMLFIIVELVSSTIYSSILYNEPVSLESLKPYLYKIIKTIMNDHEVQNQGSASQSL